MVIEDGITVARFSGPFAPACPVATALGIRFPSLPNAAHTLFTALARLNRQVACVPIAGQNLLTPLQEH